MAEFDWTCGIGRRGLELGPNQTFGTRHATQCTHTTGTAKPNNTQQSPDFNTTRAESLASCRHGKHTPIQLSRPVQSLSRRCNKAPAATNKQTDGSTPRSESRNNALTASFFVFSFSLFLSFPLTTTTISLSSVMSWYTQQVLTRSHWTAFSPFPSQSGELQITAAMSVASLSLCLCLSRYLCPLSRLLIFFLALIYVLVCSIPFSSPFFYTIL